MSSPPPGFDPPVPGGSGPSRPPRRSGSLAVLVLAGTAAVLVLALAAVIAVRVLQQADLAAPPPGAAASSSRPARSALADPDASGSPSPAATPRRPDTLPTAPRPGTSAAPQRPMPKTGLTDNSLYAVDLASGAGRCDVQVRRPKPPLKNSRLEPYLRTVVDCLVRVFRGPLADAGFRLSTPQVKTYARSIETPCGRLGSKGPPAFYCPLTRTIYWPVRSDDGQEAYTFARLGYIALAAHEFGHHLQAVTGIALGYGSRYTRAGEQERYRLSRRLELQAQCFEGVFLRHTDRVLGLSGEDRHEFEVWHSFTGDEDPPDDRNPDHGSSRAQLYWLERGLDGADFGRCDTWSAPRSRVR
ncbi:MAG: neutral zinc metallopeptidase [Actinomycetes bacterium]